jgi:hypothetical protein
MLLIETCVEHLGNWPALPVGYSCGVPPLVELCVRMYGEDSLGVQTRDSLLDTTFSPHALERFQACRREHVRYRSRFTEHPSADDPDACPNVEEESEDDSDDESEE